MVKCVYYMTGNKIRRPREPAPGECCGSGCARCVWDIYYDQLAEYEEYRSKTKENATLEASENDDISCSSSNEDSEDAHEYLGSVVLKYIDGPVNNSAILSSTAVSTVLDSFSRIQDVRVLACSQDSEASSNSYNPIRVIDVIINSNEGLKTFQPSALPLPGDVVEIFIPNEHDVEGNGSVREVEKLCRRLGLNPDQWCELHRSPFVQLKHFPSWLPLQKPIQIRTLLAYFVDIGSSSYLLRPTFFQALAGLTVHSNITATPCIGEKCIATPTFLKQCAEPETSPFIYKTIMRGDSTLCYPRLIDMLNVFDFLKPPLERLLELSGPLRPRKYSVVKYKEQDHFSSIQLCLRCLEVWEENIPKEENITTGNALASFLRASTAHRRPVFTGHVSHPLCHYPSQVCTSPMYVGTRLFGKTAFATVLKETLVSVAKGSGARLILVAAGTGIAPMMSAVNELLQYRRDIATSVTDPFNCWMIYGARNLAELVFHQQLQEALQTAAIARYDVALSRVDLANVRDCPAQSKYVTDVLVSNAEEIRTSLLEKEGKMFACGPTAVLRSIRERLAENILGCSDDDQSVREQRMKVLESKQQLMFDVWTTANVI